MGFNVTPDNVPFERFTEEDRNQCDKDLKLENCGNSMLSEADVKCNFCVWSNNHPNDPLPSAAPSSTDTQSTDKPSSTNQPSSTDAQSTDEPSSTNQPSSTEPNDDTTSAPTTTSAASTLHPSYLTLGLISLILVSL